MNTSVEVRLERVDPRGEPAAMVATWIMGELLAFSGVGVRLTGPDAVTLELASPVDRVRVRATVAALLGEPRFSQWTMQDG